MYLDEYLEKEFGENISNLNSDQLDVIKRLYDELSYKKNKLNDLNNRDINEKKTYEYICEHTFLTESVNALEKNLNIIASRIKSDNVKTK